MNLIRPPRTALQRIERQVAIAERLIAEFEGWFLELQSPEDQRVAQARLRRMRLALDMLRGQCERARAA